jgi:ABC-2 type transport system ATP-binding protein
VTVDDHTTLMITTNTGGNASMVGVLRALDDAGIPIDDVGLRRPTLDDVFLTLTGPSAEDGDVPEDEEPVPATAGSAS